jgi:hypothetical protein
MREHRQLRRGAGELLTPHGVHDEGADHQGGTLTRTRIVARNERDGG